jgi:hypothetical protein
MDPYDDRVLSRGSQEQWQAVRRAMGVVARLAERLDLAALLPRPVLTSTGFCLAEVGESYVVFAPSEPSFTVNLTETDAAFGVEWIHPVTGKTVGASRVRGGGIVSFDSPSPGDIVLHLQRLP